MAMSADHVQRASAALVLPLFLTLPNELLLQILDFSLLTCKPSTLAATSQQIRTLVDVIVYRTILIDSPETTTNLHRTLQFKSPTWVAAHVRSVTVAWAPISNSTNAKLLWKVLEACKGVRSISLPASFHPHSISSLVHSHQSTLAELTLQGYSDFDNRGRCASLHYSSSSASFLPLGLTHVRICEPSAHHLWYAPSCIVDALGSPPNLSHLYLPHTRDLDCDKDAIFVEEVEEILHRFFKLQTLVVALFSPASESVVEGVGIRTIWEPLSELAQRDPRLLIEEGLYTSKYD